jgi:uncharacterized protein
MHFASSSEMHRFFACCSKTRRQFARHATHFEIPPDLQLPRFHPGASVSRMTIDGIRERVREECLREQNVLGPSFFDEHMDVVAQYGVELAIQLGADAEIVELAGLLHDISAVRDFSTLANHANASAEIAREMLNELGYPADRADQVAQCIRTHSTPIPLGGGTVEQICVSNADAIAQIVRPAFWCYFAYGIRKMNFEDGRRWLRERKESTWEAMIEPARRMSREAYEVSVGFLREVERPLSAIRS